MHRIDNPTAATSMPAPKAPGPPGYFTAGTPGGAAPTIVEYDWMNTIQEEIAYVCEQNGVVLSKANNGQLLQAIRAILTGGTRRRLTAPTTFYVSASGNDANNGATPATAFRTLQFCYFWLQANVDCAGQAVTISIADGTYPAAGLVFPVLGQTQNIYITGNVGSPGNVIFSSATGDTVLVAHGARVSLSGMRFQNSAPLGGNYIAGGTGLVVTEAALVGIDHVDFGNCTGNHMATFGNGIITTVGAPYSISGSASIHANAGNSASIVTGLSTVTFLGTPNFSGGFLFAGVNSSLTAYGQTFAGGGCTGKRYSINQASVLDVHGANPDTYLPGTINGTTSTNGIVI